MLDAVHVRTLGVLSVAGLMSGGRTLMAQAEQVQSNQIGGTGVAATGGLPVAPLPQALLLRAELDEVAVCWLKGGAASKTRDWHGEEGRFTRTMERADRSSASVATQLRVVSLPGRKQRTAIDGNGVFRSEAFHENVSLHFEVTTSMMGVGQLAKLELNDGQRTVASVKVGTVSAPSVGDAKWVRRMLRDAIFSVPAPHGVALNMKSVCGVAPQGVGGSRIGRQCEDVVTSPAERKKILADAKAAMVRDAQFVDDNMATIEQMLPSLFPFSDTACLRELGAYGKR